MTRTEGGRRGRPGGPHPCVVHRRQATLVRLDPVREPRDAAPTVRERSPEIFKNEGLPHAVPITGMALRSLTPSRREPPRLEYVRVKDEETRKAVGTLNARAYTIPLEWGPDALDYASMWPESAFGYLAVEDGKVVSTATVVLLESCHYVGLVATPPELQRRGHGEAVMRHAIAQAEQAAGSKEIVLHATEAGRPLYRAMGFHGAAHFMGYYAGAG